MGRHKGSTNAPAAERFWRFVAASTDPGTCWKWLGGTAGGYGVLQGDDGKQVSAHRFSYALHSGVALPFQQPGHHGIVVAHVCDNRLCVNPAHLVLMTQKENLRDMEQKGRAT